MEEKLFATVKMPIALYHHIKDRYDGFELKRIKDESIDFSKNKEWKEANKMLLEAIRNREDIEFDIKESLK